MLQLTQMKQCSLVDGNATRTFENNQQRRIHSDIWVDSNSIGPMPAKAFDMLAFLN